MKALSLEEELLLLEKIHRAGSVETFIHFPQIILSGAISLEPEELDYLLSKGYLSKKNMDSFGCIFGLSPLGEKYFMESFHHHKIDKKLEQASSTF